MNPVKRLLAGAKERLEWVVALLVLLEGLQFVISFLGESFPLVGGFLERHLTLVFGMLSATSTVVLLITLVLYRIERKNTKQLEDNFQNLENKYNGILENIKLDTGRRIAQLENERNSLQDFVNKFERCAQVYRTLARENAFCEKDLFQNLLFYLAPHYQPTLDQLTQSIKTVKDNIQDILDAIASVYTEHTGSNCAACLQIIEKVDGKTLEDALVKTIMRDANSAEIRTRPVGAHRVQDNPYHRKIFINREPYVIRNDLKKLLRDGEFQTTSGQWEGLYNALLIMPIPRISDATREGYVEEEHAPVATLCVDNHLGGFGGETHLHIAKEIAWRLGVLLYRLDTLGEAAARRLRESV